jgi:hypothetical protein
MSVSGGYGAKVEGSVDGGPLNLLCSEVSLIGVRLEIEETLGHHIRQENIDLM